jgi:hypothetical protein
MLKMIEMISAIALMLMTAVGYFFDCFNFKEMFEVSYNSILILIIFGRSFLTIAHNNMITEGKRIFIESTLFIFASFCLINLYLFNTNIIFFNNKYIIQILISIICGIIFSCIKIYVLKNNVYGKKYLSWQLLDIVFVITASILSFYINEESNTRIIFLTILNIFLLGCINEHILKKLEYWIALNDFKSEIDFLILKNKIEKITYPPIENLKKDLEVDPVFSKCMILLRDTTLTRQYEYNKLIKIVKNKMIKSGKSVKDAHLISSRFGVVLDNTLMRRYLDKNMVIPAKFLNLFYRFFRKTIH